MARIRTYNHIAPEGLAVVTARGHEVGPDITEPDGIIVRSAKLHEVAFDDNLKAIARAGAGVNNIPIPRCTDAGIVVFNTPGSNANSVKELVIAALMISSRRIIEGCRWVEGLASGKAEVAKEVEAEKSRFAGPEVAGKKLGVVGLGAIGVMVANACEALGMQVIGFDPFLSIESAWGLSRSVRRARSLEALVAEVDYLTLHAPLNDDTRGIVDSALLERAKEGIRILNFARGELVDTPSMLKAVESGAVARYVTDFPEAALLGVEGVIPIPHLGASTPEAETNSAIMAARQLVEYLERGNINNGVNFPNCAMDGNGGDRLVFANRNVPNMVGQVTTILAEEGINIADLLNRHKGDLAYNIIDVDGSIGDGVVERLRTIDGIVRVRRISRQEAL